MKNIKRITILFLLFLFSLNYSSIASAETWVWPVPAASPYQNYVSGGYGDYYSSLNMYHWGLDITYSARVATPIVAARSGTVVRSLYTHSDVVQNFGSVGNLVVIQHTDGTFGIYAHMSSRVHSDGSAIQVGDWINAGEQIGTMGSTGTGAGESAAYANDGRWHLHFAVRTICNGANEEANSINVNPTFYKNGPITYVSSLTGTLDVNGLLDGINTGATENSEGIYGTFDVYINGSKVADDQTEWSKEYPAGTTYEICNIIIKNGFSFEGSVSDNLSGTIAAGQTTDVRLIFNSCKLAVKGYLDKQLKDTLGSYGTFDVVINGKTVCNDCNSFNQRVTKGASYQITDIKAKNGYEYERVYSGSLSGTIGSGTKTVRLSFYKIGELSCDWIEVNTLPGNVTTENCEIQYNNHYEKKASESPDTGWTKTGSGIVEYEDVGSPIQQSYWTDESPTLILIDTNYYHYCGHANKWVDHWQHDDYTHKCGPSALYLYDVVETKLDDGNYGDGKTRYQYRLKWSAEGTASTGWTGYATCGGTGSDWYYKQYTYQRRQAVTYYTWVKDSGWTINRDSSANSIRIRYRLKSGCGARDIVLPAGLKEIQSSAFEGSKSIEEVTIPNGVTTIGSRAFANCTNLTLVNIPSSVTSIGTNAFLNAPNLVLNCQSNNVCVSYAEQYGITYRVL